MQKILISSRYVDAHALAVAEALKDKVNVYLRFTDGIVGHELVTIDYSDEDTRISFKNLINKETFEVLGRDNLDVYWARRHDRSIIPNSVHEDDLEFVRKESTLFEQSLVSLLSNLAKRAINNHSRAMEAENKAFQLQIAKDVGLEIPQSILSNEEKQIRDFVSSKKAIYKTFYPHSWINGVTTKTIYATDVKLEDLPSPEALSWVPGIYQSKISKDFDVRLNIFGDKVIAVRLDTSNKDILDWKSEKNTYTIEKINVPLDIKRKCFSLLDRLDLEMGIFDFVVKNDVWTFLELNQMGQFLWIEDQNPEINLLQSFCEFLTGIDSSLFSSYGDLKPVIEKKLFAMKELQEKAIRK
ncbi:hypothetical protein RJ43_12265 [Alteromonas macleodii]|uniref:hypothetical protein n=1 Tax=Alteromonas macleodii TaxID=28108 RepID=UPI00057FD05A|nr:hypothetical protein [Alteromonas macleodii]KHT51446.1 hypothetical protein RJ43_12265 [Alteromonas macleodii]